MSVQADEGELERLTAEVRLLKAELATVRADQERREQREAKLRAARQGAVKTARVLSEALAEKLRAEAASTSRRGLVPWRSDGPTREEQEQLELIRSSDLFDPAWYLRQYLDVVRSGQDPALHFLRRPVRPLRQPGPDFDTAQYFDDHPGLLEAGVNPLVHFLTTPEYAGATRYPLEG